MAHHGLTWRAFIIAMALGGCAAPTDPVSLLPADVQAMIGADRARNEQPKTGAVPAEDMRRASVAAAPMEDRKGNPATASPAFPGMPPRQATEITAADQPPAGPAPGAVTGARTNVQDILARARSAPDAGPPRTGSGATASLDPMPPHGGPFVPVPDQEASETSSRPAPAPATSIAAASK